MRPSRRLAAAALAVGLLAACNQSADAGGRTAAASANGPATGRFTAPEYVMGKANAKVTVVEYLSNTCSHCARFDKDVFPQVKRQYVDTGKVRYVIREFLTPPAQVSAAGFALARCAGRDKYWPTIEALFAAQDELFRTGDVKTIYTRIGQSMGLPPAQMEACIRDDALIQGIGDRVQHAEDVDKIDGTPTFVFNGRKLAVDEVLAGKKYTGGELPLEQFAAAYRNAGGR